MIEIPVAHINVLKSAPQRDRNYNIDGVVNYIKNGGIGTLNEAQFDRAYTASLSRKGIGAYHVGELAVLWDARRFEALDKGRYRIMVGGHVGADGTHRGDNRRVGPSRFILLVTLKDKSTGTVFVASTTHLIAQAFTKHRWRQHLWRISVAAGGRRLSRFAKYSGFLNGDMNYTGPRINWPYLAEVQLPTLRTHGNERYDRAYIWGSTRMKPGSIKTFVRKSDHKGFVFTLVVGAGPTTGVPPVSQTGSGTVKSGHHPGAPVLHPWAKRTRRWKRRHPVLWRRIVRWRKKHPRKP